MKIIIDNKIPYIQGVIEQLADEVVYVPGTDFTPTLIKDADALIIRTRTRCNRELLANSQVKLIATATIGFDHIDTEYCRTAGIEWVNAPGCNADSVAQYLQSALLYMQSLGHLKLQGLTLGIVGVGNVGRKVSKIAKELGMKVLLNDPPRAEVEGNGDFASLEEVARSSDIITFHTPLVREGKYRTFHLANEAFLYNLQKKPILINTSRGEVVETCALLHALKEGWISNAIIDVWEHEPHINRELLQRVFIGTPHIAGYAADGKANATRMALDAICTHFHLSPNYHIEPPLPTCSTITAKSYEEAMLQIYNPVKESQALKEHPEQFEYFREHYPLRREAKAYHIQLLP